jgi:hypothetical protein
LIPSESSHLKVMDGFMLIPAIRFDDRYLISFIYPHP